MSKPTIKFGERLAERTTLNVGGPARELIEVGTTDALVAALAYARESDQALFVLGGGSNVVIADAGFEGLVICPRMSEMTVLSRTDAAVRVRVEAGCNWDDVVGWAVDEGLSGIECLSGIPGLSGAAPIQNIGAYGQEICETLAVVEVVERATGMVSQLAAKDCGLAYRHSHFKNGWRDRYVVVAVELVLRPGKPERPRYAELAKRVGTDADVVAIRDAVIDLRRGKSMIYDVQDPNHRSVGSFFVNPTLDKAGLDALHISAKQAGISTDAMPCFAVPVADGEEPRFKLSAAWLIERAGFSRGLVDGAAGLSSNHCLAVINRDAASADDIVRLALKIQKRVQEIYSVGLVPEPRFVGLKAI